MVKKIIPLILASSIVFSCIAPASAADTPTTGEVVNSIVQETLGSSMFNFAVIGVSTGVGTYFGHPQAGAFLGGVIADGIKEYADYIAAGFTDQDIYDQFTNYNAQLETDLGTSVFSNGGIRKYMYTSFTFGGADHSQYSYNGRDWGVTNNAQWFHGYWNSNGVDLSQKYFSVYCPSRDRAPFSGTYYSSIEVRSMTGLRIGTLDPRTGSTTIGDMNYTSGSVKLVFSPAVSSTTQYISFDAIAYTDFFPAPDATIPTSLDISAPSRPTSLVTPIAIQNSDETYTVYNNITLVDEGSKVVFDPTTGESITFTDWVYDYESRTYDLTLDGGGNMSVQFGNDSITMTQGDTVTNIFYVQEPADDPGMDNPDDPDSPGTDADVSGFFTWWKNAWNGFVDRLFTVLDGGDLEVILPGEEGNPEDEEDDGWTVFDLFALIRDALWKIITGVISVVLDGFLGLVDAIASLGDFFDIYDLANPDGIFGVPGGGVELWS